MKRIRRTLISFTLVFAVAAAPAYSTAFVFDLQQTLQAIGESIQEAQRWISQVKQWKSEIDRLSKVGKAISSGDWQTAIKSSIDSMNSIGNLAGLESLSAIGGGLSDTYNAADAMVSKVKAMQKAMSAIQEKQQELRAMNKELGFDDTFDFAMDYSSSLIDLYSSAFMNSATLVGSYSEVVSTIADKKGKIEKLQQQYEEDARTLQQKQNELYSAMAASEGQGSAEVAQLEIVISQLQDKMEKNLESQKTLASMALNPYELNKASEQMAAANLELEKTKMEAASLQASKKSAQRLAERLLEKNAEKNGYYKAVSEVAEGKASGYASEEDSEYRVEAYFLNGKLCVRTVPVSSGSSIDIANSLN